MNKKLKNKTKKQTEVNTYIFINEKCQTVYIELAGIKVVGLFQIQHRKWIDNILILFVLRLFVMSHVGLDS